MRVVVDAVLPLQLLDMPQRRLSVRTDAIVGMEQDLLQCPRHARVPVCRKVLEQRGEPLLESYGQIDPLDRNRRPGVMQRMAEYQMVAVEIAHAVVANAILAIADLDGDLHTVVAVK